MECDFGQWMQILHDWYHDEEENILQLHMHFLDKMPLFYDHIAGQNILMYLASMALEDDALKKHLEDCDCEKWELGSIVHMATEDPDNGA